MIPYALMPVPRQRFTDLDGLPYPLGTLSFYEAGTNTPKAVYADWNGVTSLGATVTLDAGGFAPALYLDRGGYKVVLADALAEVVWTEDGVCDTAGTFFNRIGVEWTAGTSTTGAYEITDDDRFVTINATTGAVPCVVTLPSAATHLSPLCVKNLGTIPVALTCSGSDTIEGATDPYLLSDGIYPLLPSVWLMADGIGAWWVIASHGGTATSLI